MSTKTPTLDVEGKFKLTAPYSVNANLLYKCIAIRSFEDCEYDKEDVYKKYYKGRGLIDGEAGFSFKNERLAGVKILTLRGQDGSYVYVPTSYVASFPTIAEEKYHHLVLSCSLGALPESFDVTAVVEQLQDAVVALTGVTNAKITLHAAPASGNPTQSQHEAMEQTRIGHVTMNKSLSQKNAEHVAEIGKLRAHIAKLMEIINARGGL